MLLNSVGVVLLCLLLLACSAGGQGLELPAVPAGERPGPVEQRLQDAHAAAARDTGDASAAGRYAMVLHAHGLYPEAAQAYGVARKLAPVAFRWAYLQGLALAASGDDRQALAPLAEAVRIDPGAGGAALGAQLLATGDLAAARKALQAVLQQDPDHARALFELGRVELAQGKLALAADQLERSAATGVEHSALLYALADVRRRQGRAAEAADLLERFERARQDGAQWPDPWLADVAALRLGEHNFIRAANAATQRGDLAAAIRANEQARLYNPHNPVPAAALVGLYAITGDHRRSEEMIPVARELGGDSPQFHYNVGLARMAQNRADEALAAMQTVTEVDPQGAVAWGKIGDIQAARGNREAAIGAFVQANERAPADQEIRLKLGVLQVQAGQYAAGLATLAAPADGLQPEARRLWAMGRAHRYLDDPAAAGAALDKAHAAAVQAGAQRLAAVIKRERGQLDAAGTD